MIAIKMMIMVMFVFLGAVKFLFLDKGVVRRGSLYNNSVSYTFIFMYFSKYYISP